MKYQILGLLFLLPIIFSGCSSGNKSDEVASYVYEEKVGAINPELLSKIGDWIQPDMVCYGLIVSVDTKGVPVKGKPVKAKVVRIQENAIEMKALENVSLSETEDCDKMGISRGKTWLEKDGELFKTKEEAINYLKSSNLYLPDLQASY